METIEIFELSGKLDVIGSKEIQKEIIPNLVKNGKVIIDMSDCFYVSSSGLRVLLIVAKQSAMQGCETVLAGVQQMVWDVIAMTGFEDMLESYPTVDEAIRALEER